MGQPSLDLMPVVRPSERRTTTATTTMAKPKMLSFESQSTSTIRRKRVRPHRRAPSGLLVLSLLLFGLCFFFLTLVYMMSFLWTSDSSFAQRLRQDVDEVGGAFSPFSYSERDEILRDLEREFVQHRPRLRAITATTTNHGTGSDTGRTNSNQPQGDYGDKTPLVAILLQSGMKESEITDDVLSQLPTWSSVTSLIGRAPRIYGLESCQRFQEEINPWERIIAPAGAFNSGTNLMAELLIANCVNEARAEKFGFGNNGVRWEAPWGKHQPPKHRLDRTLATDGKVDNAKVLPVVTVRDPYDWMHSLCRHRYATHWFHVVSKHCPNLIPNEVEREFLPQAATFKKSRPDIHQNNPWWIDDVENTANFTLSSKAVPVYVKYHSSTENHESLAHFWNDWYGSYFYTKDFPRITVRFEDLLFFGKEVTEQACGCIGGKIPRKFKHILKSAKKGKIHGDDRTSLVGALSRYKSTAGRIVNMTEADLDYARESLSAEMMEVFGYSHPE